MKKLLLTVLAALGTAWGGNCHPFRSNIVSVNAGYNLSWATSHGLNASYRPAYVIGVSDQIQLDYCLPMYLETGINFINRGYKIKGYDNSSTSLDYLQIPLGITYHIFLNEAEKFAIIPSAAFYYSIGVGGSRRLGGERVKVFGGDNGFSRHDCGFNFGVRMALSHFQVGVAFETGIINIDKRDAVYGDGNDMLGYKNVKNKSVIFSVGVNF